MWTWLWRVLGSVFGVLAVSFLAKGVFRLVTMPKRRALRGAAVLELEDADWETGGFAPSFLRSSSLTREEKYELRLRAETAAGRELKELEEKETYVMIAVACVALIVMMVYLKFF